MDRSTKSGTKHQVKGVVKELVGAVTGNKAKEREGKAEQRLGKAQQKVGKAAENLRAAKRKS